MLLVLPSVLTQTTKVGVISEVCESSNTESKLAFTVFAVIPYRHKVLYY